MAADIVNLRRERKRRARLTADGAAEANRVAFGLPKAERMLLRAEREAAARYLDGHALPPQPDSEDRDPPRRP